MHTPSVRSVLSTVVVALLTAVLLVAAAPTARAQAPEFNVTLTTDDVAPIADAVCDADLTTDGEQCTLREAVIAANLTPGPNDIFLDFDGAATIVLDIPPTNGASDAIGMEGDLDLIGDVRIIGRNTVASFQTIDASALGDRIFQAGENADVALDLRNVVLTGGSANAAADADFDDGGALHHNGGTFSVFNVEFRGNTAENDGGAVWTDGVAIDVERVLATDNVAKRGGAFHLDNSTTEIRGGVSIQGTVFRDNVGTLNGGAMYIDGGSLTLDDIDFEQNRALAHGGAVVLRSAGTALTVIGGRFTENRVTGSGGGGGAIDGASGDTVTLRGVLFERNTAGVPGSEPDGEPDVGSSGGAVNLGGGFDLVIEPEVVGADQIPTTFVDNTALRKGGAVLTDASSTITDTIFTGNEAGDEAGALHARMGDHVITGSTFTDNRVTFHEQRLSGNGAVITQGGEGGAIFSGLANRLEVDLVVTDSVFDGNSARRAGGALYLLGSIPSGMQVGFTTTATLEDNEYRGNVVTGGVATTGNPIVGRGGVLATSAAGPVVVRRGMWDPADPNGAQVASAVVTADGEVVLEDLEITDHTAGTAGAVLFEGGRHTITGSTFARNAATDGDGGALLLRPTPFGGRVPSVFVDRSSFVDNTAPGRGGGASVVGGALEFVQSSLVGSAAPTGAAVAVDVDGNLALLNTTVSGSDGAAAIDVDGSATLRNTTVARTTGGVGVATNATTSLGFVVLEGNDAACDTTDGAPTSEGGNVTDDATCGLAAGSDVVGDANLLDLMTVDGTTFHLLPPDSPAVDIADGAVDLADQPLTVDQRDVTRPRDGDGDGTDTFDAGAVELDAGILALGTADAFEAGPVDGTFTVRRVGDLTGELSVPFTVLADGGDASGQVTPTSGVAVLADGVDEVTIDVTPIDDGVGEPTRTLSLVIEDLPADGENPYAPGNGEPATILLFDDDTGVVVTAVDPDAAEPDDDGTFRVERTNSANAGDLAVHITVGGSATPGDDYAALTSPVVIPDGAPFVDVVVDVVDNGVIEPDETVTLTLEPDAAYVLGDPTTATVTIADDDEFVVTVVASDDVVAEPDDDGEFTVTRSGADPVGDLVVQLAAGGTATASSDHVALPGNVTILDGETSAVVPIEVLDDNLVEDDETVTLTVEPDAAYTVGDPDTATVTIADDDAFTVTVSASDDVAGEPEDDGEFTVTRSGADPVGELEVVVTVGGTATAGDDFTAIGSPVTIPDGETSVTVPVEVLDDTVVEDDETVTFTLEPDAAYVVGDSDTATVTIADDDAFTVTVSASDDVAGEPEDDGEFTVTRSGADPVGELEVVVTVGGTATAGDDFTAIGSPVTIPDGETSVSVPVDVLDDSVVEDDETVTLTVEPDAAYTVGDPDSATVTIADDDEFTVTVSASDADASEPDEGGEFTVMRSGADPVGDVEVVVTVGGTASTGDDYVAITSLVTIPDGETSMTVPVDVLDDSLIEDDETVTLTVEPDAAYTVGDPDTATVTIADDDVTPDPDPDPDPDPEVIRRLAGDDRVATSVALSQDAFPDGTDVAVLARGDQYPDALAGGPLAFAVGAPILLTDNDALTAATATELERLGVTTVYLLGGPAALAPQVADDVADLGVDDVRRLEGPDRFATAAAIATELLAVTDQPSAPDAWVTEGANADPLRGWPDAVSVAPLAAFQGRPILLVTRDAVPAATADALDDLGVTDVTVAGGPSAVDDAVVAALSQRGRVTVRLAGDTRYATSRAVADVARAAGMDPASTWFATGRNFADALVGGPVIAADGGVLLLLDGQDLAGSPPADAWLREFADTIDEVTLLGGPVAITDTVRTQIADALAPTRRSPR